MCSFNEKVLIMLESLLDSPTWFDAKEYPKEEQVLAANPLQTLNFHISIKNICKRQFVYFFKRIIR